MVETLERRPWRIFHRIALHLLHVFLEAAPSLVADHLTDRAGFDEPGLRHEYALLSRDQFTHLSPDNQATILRWIDAGPDLEHFKVSYEERTGNPLSHEEGQKHADHWRLRRLAPMRGALPPEWKHRYDELVAELGEPEHPEFVSYTTGGSFASTSPKSPEDLGSMSVEEIVGYLKV